MTVMLWHQLIRVTVEKIPTGNKYMYPTVSYMEKLSRLVVYCEAECVKITFRYTLIATTKPNMLHLDHLAAGDI